METLTLHVLGRTLVGLPFRHKILVTASLFMLMLQAFYLFHFLVDFSQPIANRYGIQYGGLPGFLDVLLVLDPNLALSICTVFYVWTLWVVVFGYVKSSESKIRLALEDSNRKNAYLEHAAKILRHDMHSGVNVYIPRGVNSLERRLEKDPHCVEKLKLDAPMRMIKEGLIHTQKVYAGVTEFTNLVRPGSQIHKVSCDLREILVDYLDTTSYKNDVLIAKLVTAEVNPPLFCTAIDNLIRNGLKYNDSALKMVTISMLDEDHIAVTDNGRGMTQEEFLENSRPYSRSQNQREKGTGLGLNICVAILKEHGFTVSSSKRPEGGTVIRIGLK